MDPVPSLASRALELTRHSLAPPLFLLSAVLMLGTVSPVIRFILQQHEIEPLDLAFIRIVVAFVFLLVATLFQDREEFFALAPADVAQLTFVGFLGVGLYYGLTVWSLKYTTVTHYILIYSLNPCFTAIISVLMKRDPFSAFKFWGVLLSFAGCALAVSEGLTGASLQIELGDSLVLLATIIVSFFIVLSAGIVKRYGALTANTVMFGSSALILAVADVFSATPASYLLSFRDSFLILYLGIATAAAFLLRYISLRSLTPMTVGAFHNLVPICAIALAYLFLGERFGPPVLVGGTMILAGVEMVRRG
ncbi:MAG: DMT family transporter [Nitrospirae bacterium]|nr:MAG: DMT family transporter [Nitrospirota bacterium]